MELITAKKKDALLKVLVENFEVGKFRDDTESYFHEKTELSTTDLRAIFESFQKQGLVEEYDFGSRIFRFVVLESAHTKHNRGGFQLEELVLEAELEKLFSEVARLQKKFPSEDLTKLMQIVANIGSIYSNLFNA